MKLFFTFFLLACCSFFVHAQQISTVEYFFDTDPGIGNATKIAASGSDLDATLNVNLTGLSSGVHILNVRIENANNIWSSTYQSGILISNGPAGGTSLTTAEYFFDTDPGFGNGKQIILNQPALDSVVNFDVTGLTAGAHTIYIRLKNSVNTWSYAYQGSFIVSGGTAGASQIKSLEYFSGTDAGVGQNTLIPLSAGANIDTTLSIPVADNGTDSAVLGLRLGDQTGQIGNVALSTISLCYLYKPEGGFRSAQYGNIVSLIDTSHFNTSNHVRWLNDTTTFNNGATVNYQFPGDSGSVTINQLTGTGCRTDTVTKIFKLAGIENYAPMLGSYSSDFDLDLYGGGLDTNAVVYLQKGDTVVYPYTKFSNSPQHLLAEFDFHIYQVQTIQSNGPNVMDNYILHVQYPDGHTYTGTSPISMVKIHTYNLYACNGYEVGVACKIPDSVATIEPYIAATLTGNTSIRAGIWNPMTFTFTNTGYVVAKQVMFHVIVPSYVDVDTAQWNIIMPNPDWAKYSVIIPIDTVVNGTHLLLKDISLILPYLGPGQTMAVPFNVRATNLTPFSVFYEVDKRMFGSPWIAIFPPCITAWLDGIGGFIPGYSCFLGGYDAGTNVGQAGVQIQNGLFGSKVDATGLMSAPANFLGAAISCIPGAGSGGKAVEEAVSKQFVSSIALRGGDMISGQLLLANTALSVGTGGNPCSQIADEKWLGQPILTRLAWDPNYLSGNSQYDSVKHFVNNYAPQYYSVSFENKPAATANAQHVYVTDTLNPARFVFSTLKLTQFTIADSIYSIPAFRQSVTRDVALKNRQDMKVRFTANFDTASGVLRADFFSIDNSGQVLPLASLDGFLPPDTDGISGTGSIGFSVNARATNTLDTFSNKAVIYFDTNEPQSTNTWMNTVDTTAPASAIINSVRVNDTIVKFIVQKSDIGAGDYYTTLYGKRTGDSTFYIMGTSTSDTITLIGALGQSVQLFTRETDNVNNVERKDSTAAITYTFVTAALPVHLLSFSANKETSKVKLLWTSTNEINFTGYVVEKSADGLSFSNLATVAAKAGPLTNNYQLYDEHPFAKANYYRLKQVDKNGAFTYSRIVRVDFDKAFTLAITPVPAHNYIIIDGAQNFNQIQLIDISGRVVKQFSRPTVNTFNVADIPAGIYLVRLVSDNATETLKMVKQ